MRTANLRIIKRDGLYYIQEPKRDWLWRKTGQWETINNIYWSGAHDSLENAQRTIRQWNGDDIDIGNVISG